MADDAAGAVDLDEVDAAVRHALDAGDDQGLRVLGYGEISLVIGWPADAPVVACKRLPPFPGTEAAARYQARFEQYLDLLAERGVTPQASRFEVVPGPDGTVVGYVVQPVLPADRLGPAVLRDAAPDPAHPVVTGIVAAVGRVVDPRTGLDGQLSNWAYVDGELRYLDVTTPLLFDGEGRLDLDIGVFLASYPWALRGAIGRFVAPGVIGAFRDPRHVLVDLSANLIKERLEGWLPAVLEAANRVVTPSISEAEVRRFYRSDARLWEVMLRLRRADRWWQRRVRHRAYPVLLPGPIER